ncbi:MAG: metallophosphoesterase [Desulfovibrionaceae bacterium]
MHWIAFGDIHEQIGMLERIPELPGAEGVLVTGDLTNHGTRSSGARVLDAIAAFNPNILAVIGNMDTPAVADVLDERGLNLHRSARVLAAGSSGPRVGVMGVGWSAPTPFGTPSEAPDATLGQWLEEAWALCSGFDLTVAVIHNPPHGTSLDRLPGGAHVGSEAVRRFLQEKQPAACLTGHIHEARGTDRMGATMLVNTGMLAQGGYAVLTLDGASLSVRLETAP